MKTLKSFFTICALTLLSTANAFAAFSDTYDSKKFKQFVFDVEAGYQETLMLKKASGLAVCAVAINNGYGSMLIALKPGETARFDRIYEIYKDSGNYSTASSSSCYYYADGDMISPNSLKDWGKTVSDVRTTRGGYNGVPKSKSLEFDFNDNVSYATAKDLFVDDQEVGTREEISNSSTNKFYICTIENDNAKGALHLVLLPNSTSTYHVMANTDGDWGTEIINCEAFRTNATYKASEIKRKL